MDPDGGNSFHFEDWNMFSAIDRDRLCTSVHEMKSLRKFPIGSMVRWLHDWTLEERYGLVVAYVDIATGVDGRSLMALQIFTDGVIEYVGPNNCRTISRPYVKQKSFGKSVKSQP